MLNVHHLELFHYVARHGGITAALPHIPWSVQQPALSSQLLKLEESLGTRLFHRRPFALTPAGREVYEFIAPFFANLPHLAASICGESSRHLRIGAASSALRDHLPGLIRTLRDDLPKLRLTLREVRQPSAERLLREHEIDLAITPLEGPPSAGVRHRPLLKLPPVLLAGPTWPFASAAELWRHATLDDVPLIAMPPHERITRLFEQELARRGKRWPVRIEASSLDIVHSCVAEGFGVGLALEVPRMKLAPGVRVLPLRGFPPLVVAALWMGRLNPLTQKFLDLAQATARQLASVV